MKKKSIVIISVSVAVILVAIVAGFVFFPYITNKDFAKTLNYNPDEITKIVFMSGSTGEKAETTDKDDIDEFLELFRGISLKKISDSTLTGFTISVNLYSGTQNVSSFTFGISDEISTKNTRYLMDKKFTEEQIGRIIEKYNLK